MVKNSLKARRAARYKMVYGTIFLFVFMPLLSIIAGALTAIYVVRHNREPTEKQIVRKVILPETIATLPDRSRIGIPQGFSITEKRRNRIVINARDDKRIKITISIFRSTFADKSSLGIPVWSRAPRRYDIGPWKDDFEAYAVTVFQSVFTDSVIDRESVQANDEAAFVVAYARDMSYFRMAYLTDIGNGNLCLMVYSYPSSLDTRTQVRAALERFATIMAGMSQ